MVASDEAMMPQMRGVDPRWRQAYAFQTPM